MTRYALADTYQDLHRLDAARTRASLLAATLQSLARYGVEKAAAGLISPLGPPDPETPVAPLLWHWENDWFDYYRRRNFYYFDPVFFRQSGPHGAARWRDVFAGSRHPVELQIIGGARECGLRDGVTFTIPTLGGEIAAISIAGAAIDCGEADIGRMAFVAHFAIGKALCLDEALEAAPALTPRERDVLLWTCEGKTEWEIGAILGVSEHSADKYVRRLKAKLQAASKAQLVARAFRLGLVQR